MQGKDEAAMQMYKLPRPPPIGKHNPLLYRRGDFIEFRLNSRGSAKDP